MKVGLRESLDLTQGHTASKHGQDSPQGSDLRSAAFPCLTPSCSNNDKGKESCLHPPCQALCLVLTCIMPSCHGSEGPDVETECGRGDCLAQGHSWIQSLSVCSRARIFPLQQCWLKTSRRSMFHHLRHHEAGRSQSQPQPLPDRKIEELGAPLPSSPIGLPRASLPLCSPHCLTVFSTYVPSLSMDPHSSCLP